MTLGGVTCDQVLENEERVLLAAKNQTIQRGAIMHNSFTRALLRDVPDSQGTRKGDICSLGAVLIHLLSGHRLTDAELSDMEKNKVVPKVVGRINDWAARDFIITACI